MTTDAVHSRVWAQARGETVVIGFRDPSLDAANAEAATRELLELARGLPEPRLQLDLDGLTYVSSAGLATFMALFLHVRAAAGKLALVNVEPQVYEVLGVTRLIDLLNAHPKGGATGLA